MAKVAGACASDHAKVSETELSFITTSVFYITNTSLVFFCRRLIALDLNVRAIWKPYMPESDRNENFLTISTKTLQYQIWTIPKTLDGPGQLSRYVPDGPGIEIFRTRPDRP
jgi:hypothetical protein